MPTFEEYEPERFVSFKEKKTQRVYFQPRATVKEGTFEGRKTMSLLVQQNGKDAWLSISSKRLVDQLKNFKESITLDITQTGSGTATTYKVEAVKK